MAAPAAARSRDGSTPVLGGDSPALGAFPRSAGLAHFTGASRRALVGFFLIGMLVALPGALLPAWGYHFRPDFVAIGLHFLCQTAGVLLTLRLARRILSSQGAQRTMIAGMLLAVLGILWMGMLSLPGAVYLNLGRNAGMFVVGLAAGLLMAASFQLLHPLYEHDSAATVNLCGGLLGLGSLLPSSLGALAYSWSGFEGFFSLLAIPPAIGALRIYRRGSGPEPALPDLGFREVFEELRSPVHVLFAGLLFFQTAAELSIAGWTSLHLILRVGMSPSESLFYVSFYWFCLVLGRVVAQGLIRRWPHRQILPVSSLMAWLGILLLAATDNRFGALLGLGLTGLGFAFVYPLLVERIGGHFQKYHASLFHGIFGIGMLGGFLAPALIGWIAEGAGIGFAMAVPMAASFAVFVLLFAIWVESKLSAKRPA